MAGAGSLSNRIFLACTLLATLSLGLAFVLVNISATREAEADLRRRLHDAAALADQHRATTLTDTFTRLARLVADLPKLKAAVETGDPPTVQPLAEDYRAQMRADLLVLCGRDGRPLASVGAEGTPLADVGTPASTAEYVRFEPHARGLLQVVSVPIQVGTGPAEVLGRLIVGVFLDHDRALQFKDVTGSEIVFGAGARVLASSFGADRFDALRSVLDARQVTAVTIGGEEYLALARTMVTPALPVTGAAGRGARPVTADAAAPVVVVLRSRSEGLQFLDTLRAGLGGGLLLAVVLATIISYGVARTITRPLSAVTGAMADVAATGDLSRRVPVQSRAWDDADARLLAGTFNTLTESIARFRRDETQRERLSSLGRLSTVIAHEIRNPLMIIRASLRTLRRDELSPDERRDAVADIDEETARLNRIVSEVLDFARPLRFELADASLNDICRRSAAAATTDGHAGDVVLDLDPAEPRMQTDGERLRTVLVNVLSNARAAVQAAHAAPEGGPPGGAAPPVTSAAIVLRTRCRGADVRITVEDAGTGIDPADAAHIFDPYFTTRRGGTGLGLPIAKNIVDGLHGTITAHRRPGSGTTIVIDLPVAGPEKPA
jgi:signal transduction histidine kinase